MHEPKVCSVSTKNHFDLEIGPWVATGTITCEYGYCYLTFPTNSDASVEVNLK